MRTDPPQPLPPADDAERSRQLANVAPLVHAYADRRDELYSARHHADQLDALLSDLMTRIAHAAGITIRPGTDIRFVVDGKLWRLHRPQNGNAELDLDETFVALPAEPEDPER